MEHVRCETHKVFVDKILAMLQIRTLRRANWLRYTDDHMLTSDACQCAIFKSRGTRNLCIHGAACAVDAGGLIPLAAGPIVPKFARA
jgi:hypothetical protein